MNVDGKIEAILQQVKDKLNSDKIKLWLPPYVGKSTACDTEIETLAKSYSAILEIPVESVFAALKELQQHALERLKERDRFQATGTATIRVKVPEKKIVALAIKLSETGEQLQQAVAAQIDVEPERVKLIWNGKVLKTSESLGTQGLKNGIQIMALVMQHSMTELMKVESRHRLMESTRADARLLARKRNDEHDQYLQLTDQAGNTLRLPVKEREALIVAMSLHEKGRAALKDDDFALALVLLLEADKEFSACTSQLLQAVDNYALLNLDIAWCYLNLRSLQQLPDAESRLKKCEESFHRSYGENLERLLALKGTAGNEAALFMRLHLLQAIVFYHQNKCQATSELLQRAESELQTLKVDDNKLGTLLELGYSAAESRLALRAAHGDVQAAVDLITVRRQERAELLKKEAEQRRLNSERKKLGKCVDNKQWVEPHFHQLLVGMGYPSEAARRALQQTNNNMALSVQLIQDHPSLLDAVSEGDSIDQVVAVGFDRRMAKLALRKHSWNIAAAIEELVVKDGFIEGELEEESSTSSSESDLSEAHRQARKDEMEAFSRLSAGMSTGEEDYLDLTLVAEERFLHEYKSLLQASQQASQQAHP